MQESVEISKAYVAALDTECTLTDGYVCKQVEEDDFLSRESGQRLVPGPYLQVWQVCLTDFQGLTDLSTEQKQLRHYKIGFTETDGEYIVLFQGLLLPEVVDGKATGVIRAVFGLSTKYWVDKKTLTINKRLYLR